MSRSSDIGRPRTAASILSSRYVASSILTVVNDCVIGYSITMAQKKRKQQAVPTEEQKALKRETLRKWHAANPEKRRELDCSC